MENESIKRMLSKINIAWRGYKPEYFLERVKEILVKEFEALQAENEELGKLSMARQKELVERNHALCKELNTLEQQNKELVEALEEAIEWIVEIHGEDGKNLAGVYRLTNLVKKAKGE